MGTFRKATTEELQEIEASVEVAVEQLKRICWNTHKPKRGRLHIPNQPSPPDNAACRRYLQKNGIREMVLEALNRGDGHFFVKFGKDLSKIFVFIEDTMYPLVPVLPAFLVDHWATPKNGLPAFCYLRLGDLTQICSKHLMDDSLSEEAIAKMRQRLKLKPFRLKLLPSKYDADGSPIFPQMDN